ncbi:LemA family protein [Desmospora activa]|uniref:LemA protein n=1 Tax=Desmospora activa DSM 45169 TaxID=1121389 RepID=A0A2T4Z8T4_9BACL|nr:LemA family protein [Desmospora activa]PTM58301.1 LemA protein [Desmospora activa DSM 45169]
MTLLIVGIVVAVFILFWIINYNSLVKYRNWVEEAWAQIDVQLKRRYDLIPNLVETVKGYAKHETETLEKVIEARNRMFSQGNTRNDEMTANDQISAGLKNLFALSESYPELKANENFMMLQEELAGTENKISYSRQSYNKTVMEYNTKVETIPTNIIASIHGFKRRDLLSIPAEERQNVKVSF